MMLLIRDCKLLTWDHENHVLEHMDILIRGNRITLIGQHLPVDTLTPDRIIDGQNTVALPGLVNADLHPWDLAFRGFFENIPLEILLFYLSAPQGILYASPDQLHDLALLTGITSLKFGVTSITYHLTLSSEGVIEKLRAVKKAFDLLGLRATIALDIRILNQSGNPSGFIAPKTQMYDQLSEHYSRELQQSYLEAIQDWQSLGETIVRFSIAPSIEMILNPTLAAWLAETVATHHIPLHLHAHTTKSMLLETMRHIGGFSLIQVAHQAGLLSENTQIVDAVWVDENDIALIAESGAIIVNNPMSDLYLGSGVFPMNKFLEAHIPISLGTGIATGGNLNLFDCIKMAASIQRIVQPDHRKWPTVDQILKMALWKSANQFSPYNQTGKLEDGCIADIILLNDLTFSLSPLNNVVDQLVCLETGDAVNTVIVGGEIVLENKRSSRTEQVNSASFANRLNREMRMIYENTESWCSKHQFALQQAYMGHVQAPLPFTRWANSQVVKSRLQKAAYKH